MSAIAGIPTLVEPEASLRVTELGMQKEFEIMLDHVRQVIPELLRIHVTLEPPYDTGDQPRIVIEAMRGGQYLGDDPSQRQWARWEAEEFSVDICRHFTMLVTYGSSDAR